MPRIEVKCPKCGRHVPVIKETRTKRGSLIRKWKCGHSKYFKPQKRALIKEGHKEVCKDCLEVLTEENLAKHQDHEIVSIPVERDPQWTRLYAYQQRGVEFIESQLVFGQNPGVLIGDEMGLGKTAQTLMALRYNYKEMSPVLIIAPAGHIFNWYRECQKWINDKYNDFEDTPIVHTKNVPLMSGQKVVIISNMMLAKPKVLQSILEYGFKTIIADESHHFKNDNSSRTGALMEIAKNSKRLLLSGTSVLNRTIEFFNSLHLCNEYHWRHKGDLARMCMTSREGKILAISPHWKDAFNERISNYVLRRTKKELFRELPPITITNTFVDVRDNPTFVNLYNEKLDELELLLNQRSGKIKEVGGQMQVIALIQQLWEYTALAKVKHVVAYAQEFLENTKDNGHSPKLTLGGHHRMPRGRITELLGEYNPITITDQNAQEKDRRQFEFNDSPDKRLCIASILGAGEGRNLNFCHNVILYERYWNPAKEKQFIGRFWARGLNPDTSVEEYEPVTIDYLLATDTIDEFFSSMVELKSEIVQSAIDHDHFADVDFIQNLAENVVRKRLKYVGG
jgi:non-specific serine/threonine protein kinase